MLSPYDMEHLRPTNGAREDTVSTLGLSLNELFPKWVHCLVPLHEYQKECARLERHQLTTRSLDATLSKSRPSAGE